MSTKTNYLGYYMNKPLAKDEEPAKNENGKYNHFLACFNVLTGVRKCISMLTEHWEDYAFGELLWIETTGDSELYDGALVTLKRTDEIRKKMNIEHETGEKVGLVVAYTLKNVQVSQKELPSPRVYRNEMMGVMKDPNGLMEPATYFNITYQLNPTARDGGFEIVILGANTMNEQMEQLARKLQADRFERMPEVLKVENDTNVQTNTESWKKVGLLRLEAIDKESLLTGIRPVFGLVDLEKGLIFDKLIQSALIHLIKVNIVKEEGEEKEQWIDDPNFDPKIGTALPYKQALKTIVKLKKESLNAFQHDFQIGDFFRVEADISADHYRFWKEKKYDKSEMFKKTLDGEFARDKGTMYGLVESRAMQKEELEALVDKKTLNTGLNEMQLKAVMMAMNEARKLVCIQGPPGTGKTHTLAVLIAKLMQTSRRDVVKRKAIVLTPTREAMKNIMTAAKAMIEKMKVPIHEHGLMDQATFLALVEGCPENQELAEKLDGWEKNVQDGLMTYRQKDKLKEEHRSILHTAMMKEVMKNVRVVFSTISSQFAAQATRDQSFQDAICIIDEAAQMKEVDTWPTVINMSRIVLAGDPSQLPALVVTAEARDFNLGASLMTRIMEKKDQYSWIMLRNQYRSHPDITEWSSKSFYDQGIVNCADTLGLRDMMKTRPPRGFEKLFEPMVLIDTSYENEKFKNTKTFEHPTIVKDEINHQLSDSLSFRNLREAEIVLEHYMNLLKRGIPVEEMAIITPYRGQKELVEDMFRVLIEEQKPEGLEFEKIKIGTVDSYQGQEFTVVIFSMVRSNPKFNLGFVGDLPRLNVAITRAMRHFMLVGNGIMLKKCRDPKIRDLYQLFEDNKRRFPPCFVFGEQIQYDMKSDKNNFGKDMGDFKEHCINWTDGGEMYNHCVRFVKRRDENYMERQRKFNEQRRQY